MKMSRMLNLSLLSAKANYSSNLFTRGGCTIYFLKGIKKRKFDLYRTLYQIKAKRTSVCKPTDTIGQMALNCKFPNMYLADL